VGFGVVGYDPVRLGSVRSGHFAIIINFYGGVWYGTVSWGSVCRGDVRLGQVWFGFAIISH
jgi:hypothetical protein